MPRTRPGAFAKSRLSCSVASTPAASRAQTGARNTGRDESERQVLGGHSVSWIHTQDKAVNRDARASARLLASQPPSQLLTVAAVSVRINATSVGSYGVPSL